MLPRTGRQFIQLCPLRPNPLCNTRLWLRKDIYIGCHRRLQTSVVESDARQRVWKTIHAKRAWGVGAIVSIGLGISALARPKVLCEAPPGIESTSEIESYGPVSRKDYPPPPQTSLSLFELSFGAVAGICSGVFVKKGAKAVAWFLGGIFVLLQYLGSKSLVRVDWTKVSSRFEHLFYSQDGTGSMRPPSFLALWKWLIDFLTADFQPRASFIAGFALGLRLG